MVSQASSMRRCIAVARDATSLSSSAMASTLKQTRDSSEPCTRASTRSIITRSSRSAATLAHEESAASVTSILRSPAGCTQDGSRRANIRRKKLTSTPIATTPPHAVTTMRGMGSRISNIKRYVYGPQNWQTSVPSATRAAARYTIARARLSTRTWRSFQISALEMQNGSHHYKRAGSGALRTRIRLIYSTRLACSLHYAQICTA